LQDTPKFSSSLLGSSKKLTAIYQSCISFYHLVISTPCHIQMDILSILAEEVNLAWAFSHSDLTGGYNLEKI